MTTKFLRGDRGQGSVVHKPSLGLTWAQQVDHRLVLRAAEGNARILELDQSIYRFAPLYSKPQMHDSSMPKRLVLNEFGLIEAHEVIK